MSNGVSLNVSLPSRRKGRFVALNTNGKCLAQGNDVVQVVRRARRAGCRVPIVLTVSPSKGHFLIL